MPKKKNLPNNKRPQSLSGLVDILPENGHNWDYLLNRLARMSQAYGFLRAEAALLEDYDLYENFDIEKGSIINFNDAGNNRIAIRPEVLPGLMRAHSERKNIPEGPKIYKWYYISPVAGYNEQSGKLASSWEYGFELFGDFVPLNEVQIIGLMWKFLKSAGFENISLEVNSVGKAECRKDYDENLRNFLQNKKYELCNECVAAIESYPLRVFRCKNLGCKTVAAEAPQVVDFLDEDCHKHFTHVLEGLDELGITYSLNPMLVGREGTSQVTFSLKYKETEGQNEHFVGEGACHENIYEAVTGKKMQSFGFSGNLEVLRQALSSLPFEQVHINELKPEVFLVPLGDLAAKKALRLFSELWDENIAVHDHFGNIGVKNQLKMAENSKAVLALIIGQKEAMDEMVILRDVKSGMQEIFQYERIIEEVKKRLGR
jgi:histidyl-tRNA synthetase